MKENFRVERKNNGIFARGLNSLARVIHARDSFKKVGTGKEKQENQRIILPARNSLKMKVAAGLLALSLGGACASGKSTITEATITGAVAGAGTFGSLYLLDNVTTPGKADVKVDAVAAGIMAVGIILLYCAVGGGDGSSGYEPSPMREQWGEDQYERNREWQRQQQFRNVPYR